MGYFNIINKGAGPVRLFVGGVHGNEGLTTIKALSIIGEEDIKDGKLIIYNCDESKYISTLDERYYNLPVGKEILSLITNYQPEIYVEPHCYRPDSFSKLTDKDRKKKVGVPPLIELEEGVLIGSVSPFIRINYFRRQDVCVTLEIPCSPSPKALDVYINVLKVIAGSKDRSEIEDKLKVKYPSQVKTARTYALEFFGNYPPF
ncbi:MAG: DUF2119 domain-containing protein [Euryarchaeota archaeon]|nr:DUF2119 domain-containing protein [Euryarchaeota archaeon]